MARIAGVSLPRDKKVKISLTYINGIGHSKSQLILNKLNIDPELRLKDVSEDELNLLREEIEKRHQVEGTLRRAVAMDIKRLKEINCYRGMRHRAGLPSRGQNTKTNARTKRGKRVNVGSGRKKALAKK